MYCAEAGERRIECRFPAATTDHKKVTNLVEFLTLVREFVHNHPDKWIDPVLRDYRPVLENFTAFLLSTKKGKHIGNILHNGYPSTR
jgi:hypothetical protein